MHSATSRLAWALARSPTSRPAGCGEHGRRGARSLPPARGRRASSSVRPPGSGCAARRASDASRRSPPRGRARPRSAQARQHGAAPPRRRPRALSASPRSDPQAQAPATRAVEHRLDAPPHPRRTRNAHQCCAQTRCRSPRVARVLRAAVLERDVADLPTFRCAAMLRTEPLRRLRDLTVTVGERVPQRRRGPPRSRSTCRPGPSPARSRNPPLASSCASAER